MDQNGSSSLSSATEDIETSSTKNRSSKYDHHLFVKRTLQFLLPISVLSFLLAYASCFSFIFTYNLHISTLLFALFSRALERKYMFLICNGILAFIVKTLSFNSCPSLPPPHGSDFMIREETMKTTEDQNNPTSSVPQEETAVLPVQYYSAISKSVAIEEQEKHEKEVYVNDSDKQEEEKAHNEGGQKQSKSQMGSSLIITSDDIYSTEDDDYYETDTEESAAAAAGGNEINLNTEELNQKFEEFIRKMKEEIRIEAQQQLVVA